MLSFNEIKLESPCWLTRTFISLDRCPGGTFFPFMLKYLYINLCQYFFLLVWLLTGRGSALIYGGPHHYIAQQGVPQGARSGTGFEQGTHLAAGRRANHWATPHPNWATPHTLSYFTPQTWATPHPLSYLTPQTWATPHPLSYRTPKYNYTYITSVFSKCVMSHWFDSP